MLLVHESQSGNSETEGVVGVGSGIAGVGDVSAGVVPKSSFPVSVGTTDSSIFSTGVSEAHLSQSGTSSWGVVSGMTVGVTSGMTGITAGVSEREGATSVELLTVSLPLSQSGIS